MQRPVLLLLSVVLLASGCGGGDAPDRAERAATVAPAHLAGDWRTDFGIHDVPLEEIRSGGPPKDGIPAIDDPVFVPPSRARYLADDEPVLAVTVGDTTRGYPLEILVWHEIVNDRVGGTPLTITYCPLCNTAIVFDRRLDGRTLDFGTTGNLRHSDLVMYDRQTESWWQQFDGTAIVGELTGATLGQVPSQTRTAAEFRRRHPDGEVLSRQTGFDRPYGTTPYAGYDAPGSRTLFPTPNADDDRLDPKTRVVFIRRGGEAVAIPHPLLAERRRMVVEVGGERLRVRFTPSVRSVLDDTEIRSSRAVGAADVTSLDGAPVPFIEPFWFAVAAFDPDIRIVG